MFDLLLNFRRRFQHTYLFLTSFLLAFSAGCVPAYASDGDVTIEGYLSGVATVFQWILEQITVLISFIFGNPFLAVSLYLFMAGVVIAFFIRIKMS